MVSQLVERHVATNPHGPRFGIAMYSPPLFIDTNEGSLCHVSGKVGRAAQAIRGPVGELIQRKIGLLKRP